LIFYPKSIIIKKKLELGKEVSDMKHGHYQPIKREQDVEEVRDVSEESLQYEEYKERRIKELAQRELEIANECGYSLQIGLQILSGAVMEYKKLKDELIDAEAARLVELVREWEAPGNTSGAGVIALERALELYRADVKESERQARLG
jgi:hypothetical protein